MCCKHGHKIGTIYNFQFIINLKLILMVFVCSKWSRLWFLLTETLGKNKNSLPLETSNYEKTRKTMILLEI